MGQIGSTSSSMLVEEKPGSDRWVIAMSRGVKIDTEGLYFARSQGILSLLADPGRIIDIDEYRNDESYRDDYLTYLSVDARYIAPVMHGNKLTGAVLLGEKVSVEDYTEKEKGFISQICDSAASVLNGMLEKERLNQEISALKKNLGELNMVESLQDMIVHEGSIEKLESVIRDEFDRQGITCYALFGRMREGNSFSPVITEREDFLSLRESSFNIEEKSLLVRHLSRSEAPVIIDNFRDADLLKNSFSGIQLSRMSIFRAYPFVLGERVMGFIFIFRARENIDLRETDLKIRKISRFIFAYLHLIRETELSHRRQIDDMELVYQRIDKELDNAREIGIPVSLVLFSIKNFRRYYNAYGYERSRILLRDTEKIIADRLGDPDFSVRYGRNRFLVVLPGKDRKYAVPLASAVRNRIVDSAGEKDGQLLVTFLIAQFPDDGNDPFSLMDSLE
jgi:diguanylate cyclase (GGDEF)-like protein